MPLCADGTTCYQGTQYHIQCPAGTYGKFDMLADKDTANSALRVCEPCPAGYLCASTGMTVPTPCGRGKYSAAGEALQCTDCLVGHYCEREDTSDTMMTANTCAAGYQCPLNTEERPFNDHDD